MIDTEQKHFSCQENNVIEFILNWSSSAYFAMGAVSVTIVILVLLVAPLVNQMKQLDKIVMEKLSMSPTSDTYTELFSVITDQNQLNDSLLQEYEEIKFSVDTLTETLIGINKIQGNCEENMEIFTSNMKKLESTLDDYVTQSEFNSDKSSKQINSLVKARIDTTTFLINMIESLKETNNISVNFDASKLYEIRENLKVGAETIKNMNYRTPIHNQKSGAVDKLTDSEY